MAAAGVMKDGNRNPAVHSISIEQAPVGACGAGLPLTFCPLT
jgi:hypothetical protein